MEKIEDLIQKLDEECESGRYSSYSFLIMMGVPGSGKTTLANRILYEIENSVYYNIDNKDESYYSTRGGYDHDPSLTIIDGLFSSYDDFIKKYSSFREKKDDLYYNIPPAYFFQNILKEKSRKTNVFVAYFIPNVKNCLANDELRGRADPAIKTIEGMSEVMVSPKGLPNLEVYELEVPCYADKKPSSFLISQYQRGGEDIADGFTELDEWLEKNYPKVSFLMYKKIQKLIEIEEKRVYDYYDEEGTETVRWKIDLTKVIELIEKMEE